MVRLPVSNARARASRCQRPHRMARILPWCSRWTTGPCFCVTLPARPHHTVQLWRRWITVEMWTRYGTEFGRLRQTHHGPLRLCEIELVRGELEVTRNRSARGAATRPFGSSGAGNLRRRRLRSPKPRERCPRIWVLKGLLWVRPKRSPAPVLLPHHPETPRKMDDDRQQRWIGN